LQAAIHKGLFVQQRSSIFAELGWLAFFLVMLVIYVYAFNIWLVPHHFNDKIADTIAGILAGMTMIAVRARWRR
jgi:hypothetical protein